MRYDIFCFIPGDQSTFPIKIDETERVGHLKTAIKAEKAAHKIVDTSSLKLYRVQVDESCNKAQRINELERLSQELDDELTKLSGVFGGSPPQGMQYFVLVQVSEGKSVYCGGVMTWS